jgi:DNA-directed RNA polymerase specialized sigma24 family protein
MLQTKHPILPEDATPEEIEFLEFSIVDLYRSLERKEDMFLVAFCYDLGYKKSLAAQILNLSNASITSRLQDIRDKLKNGYAKNKLKKEIE